MLRLFVLLGAAAAAAAGCSDTCTHPGVKVFELAVGDTVQDCSAYGPGLSTPATADECKEAMLATETFKQGDTLLIQPQTDVNYNSCAILSNAFVYGRGDGTQTKTVAMARSTQICKCSACPASSSSTGTGWTLLGLALGAGSAGGAIAYGAAQAP